MFNQSCDKNVTNLNKNIPSVVNQITKLKNNHSVSVRVHEEECPYFQIKSINFSKE